MSEVAIVFPGQGSQSVGMLAELATQYDVVTQTFNRVSEQVGYDVWALTQKGPEAKLNQTEYTQVAMLTADVAVYAVGVERGMPNLAVMAGHSLGEYAALVCAGSLNLLDAAQLVATRGRLMQETVPLGVGAMAAIVGLDDEAVRSLCDAASTAEMQVTPANYNAIGQVVIAGHTPAVRAAMKLAEAQGARMAIEIPVSVPCHCALLSKAAERFADALANTPFNKPMVKVISNVDLSIYDEPNQIRRLLQEQLYSPVRWVETIQTIKALGVETILECGPGRVLTGLVKRIDKSLKAANLLESMG